MDVARRWTRLALTIASACLVGCSLMGPTTATSFLNQIEKSRDPNERFKAYQSLASPRCYDNDEQKARAVKALIKGLEPGKEPLATRAVICRTLGVLGDPAARDPIIVLVRDPDPLIRVEACRSLGKIGRPEDATVLMRAMTLDTNPDCQVAAIEALGTLKTSDPRTPGYLVQAMENDDPAIRLAAYEALRKITGKDLGVKVDPWRALIVANENKAGGCRSGRQGRGDFPRIGDTPRAPAGPGFEVTGRD